MMKDNSSKQILLSVLGVAILVVAVVGVSFAAFSFSQAGTVENTISTGTITMTYTEGDTGISITDAMPMKDETGKELSADNEKFEFTVGATISGVATINYEVAAIKKSGTIADEDIRLYLEKDGAAVFGPSEFTGLSSATSLGAPAGSMIIDSGTFTATLTNSYVLRMWLADDAPIDGTSRNYVVTVNVYGRA